MTTAPVTKLLEEFFKRVPGWQIRDHHRSLFVIRICRSLNFDFYRHDSRPNALNDIGKRRHCLRDILCVGIGRYRLQFRNKRNNDTKDNAFSLAASQTNNFPGSLPSGWTVKFVAGGAACSASGIVLR